MWYLNLQGVSQWFFQHEALILAGIATLSAALLIVCAVGCSCAPCAKKDRLFHRTVY